MDPTEEPATTVGEDTEIKFSAVDYTLFILMLVASISIGVISAIRNRNKVSTQEYLMGGRNMPAAPVTLSLLGGWISAISILGNPTEIYFFGTQIAMILLGAIPGCFFVSIVIIPILYNLRIVSINEYIELRFESRLLRTLATLCNLLNVFIYMGICLYAPTLAVSTVTGLATWASTLILGTICTFYITIGGVKAVVYTDVLQTLLMFGGVLVVVILCCIGLGGVDKVWAIADRGGRIQFFNLDTSPFERHTLMSTMVFGCYFMVSTIGFNQNAFQRLASVRTLQTSQRLVMVFLVGLCTLWSLFYFSGLVAYATYSDCDPLTTGKIDKPDQIIPFLVTDKLSHLPGLAGIFVAAVYGGVLSTLSSCGNSFACVVWEDFLKERPYFSRLGDVGATNVVKILSVMAGVAAICMGLMVEKLGSIFHVANIFQSAVGGPLSGLFFTGVCAPWVNAKGAVVGFVLSFIFSVWVVIGKFVRGGGSPPRLPLSTEGCPENLALFLNATVTGLVNTTIRLADTTLTTTALPDAVPANTTAVDGTQSNTIYEISYCYTGIIAVALTFIISSLVSLLTGPNSPEDVSKGVVSPACARAYKRVWESVKGRPTYTVTQDIINEEEEAFKMLPRHNTDNLNTSS